MENLPTINGSTQEQLIQRKLYKLAKVSVTDWQTNLLESGSLQQKSLAGGGGKYVSDILKANLMQKSAKSDDRKYENFSYGQTDRLMVLVS